EGREEGQAGRQEGGNGDGDCGAEGEARREDGGAYASGREDAGEGRRAEGEGTRTSRGRAPSDACRPARGRGAAAPTGEAAAAKAVGRGASAPQRAGGPRADHLGGRHLEWLGRAARGYHLSRAAPRRALPGAHGRALQRPSGELGDEEPRSRRRRRRETVASKGDGPRASGLDPRAALAARWRRVRPERPEVRAADPGEDAP